MPRKKKSKVYFTKDTENAIVQYNNEKNQSTRNQIYNKDLAYPLDKMAENIINTFKFEYFDVSFSDLKHEVVAFMLVNLHKYEAHKGKAFSYFSIVAKNYLILHNNNNYKKIKTHFDLDVVDNEWDAAGDMVDKETQEYTKEFIKQMIPYFEGKLEFIFKNKRDIIIADCIIELFKKIDNIENFNKKSLYLLIREMCGYKTQQLTKVINTLKTHYIQVNKQFKNTGDITTENFLIYE